MIILLADKLSDELRGWNDDGANASVAASGQDGRTSQECAALHLRIEGSACRPHARCHSEGRCGSCNEGRCPVYADACMR